MLTMKKGRRKLQLAAALCHLTVSGQKPDGADDADGSLPLRANHTSRIVLEKSDKTKLRVKGNTVSIVRTRHFPEEESLVASSGELVPLVAGELTLASDGITAGDEVFSRFPHS